MGQFINVIGCKGLVTLQMSRHEKFSKRPVECIDCQTKYNSKCCHKVRSDNSLMVIFDEVK